MPKPPRPSASEVLRHNLLILVGLPSHISKGGLDNGLRSYRLPEIGEGLYHEIDPHATVRFHKEEVLPRMLSAQKCSHFPPLQAAALLSSVCFSNDKRQLLIYDPFPPLKPTQS